MSKNWLSLSKRMTAALALAMFCWLNVLAVAPVLHAAAHCESSDASAPCDSQPVNSEAHQCAVTLISNGQLELIVPPCISAAPDRPALISPPVCVPVYSSVDRRLAPGRAPPVLPA